MTLSAVAGQKEVEVDVDNVVLVGAESREVFERLALSNVGRSTVRHGLAWSAAVLAGAIPTA